MMVHAFNHSTLEAKAGRSHEFEFSLVYRVGYTEKSCPVRPPPRILLIKIIVYSALASVRHTHSLHGWGNFFLFVLFFFWRMIGVLSHVTHLSTVLSGHLLSFLHVWVSGIRMWAFDIHFFTLQGTLRTDLLLSAERIYSLKVMKVFLSIRHIFGI